MLNIESHLLKKLCARCVLPLSEDVVKEAAPTGNLLSSGGGEEPILPHNLPWVPPYGAASMTHTSASLGSKLPTEVWTDTGGTCTVNNSHSEEISNLNTESQLHVGV